VIGAKFSLTVLFVMATEQRFKIFEDLEMYLEPEERFRKIVENLCGLILVIVDKRVYLLR
jgi:hypothetical protein